MMKMKEMNEKNERKKMKKLMKEMNEMKKTVMSTIAQKILLKPTHAHHLKFSYFLPPENIIFSIFLCFIFRKILIK